MTQRSVRGEGFAKRSRRLATRRRVADGGDDEGEEEPEPSAAGF
jgi:hypothetical protein